MWYLYEWTPFSTMSGGGTFLNADSMYICQKYLTDFVIIYAIRDINLRERIRCIKYHATLETEQW